MPGTDVDGTIQTFQRISSDGEKRFLTGGQKTGAMHVVGVKSPKDLGQEGPIIIAEGYATAATIHEATGRPVVVAFDASNLKPVAQALRERHPEAGIVIAADNDHQRNENIGKIKATEAAKAADGMVVSPLFNKEQKERGLTDYNDLAWDKGPERVAKAIKAAVRTMEQDRGNDRTKEMAMAV